MTGNDFFNSCISDTRAECRLDRNSPADRVNLLVVTEREAWMTQHPRYPFARQPVGVGELMSATFVARRLNGDSLRTAFEHAVSAFYLQRLGHQGHDIGLGNRLSTVDRNG